MSFRGLGGSGSGGADPRRDQPARLSPTDRDGEDLRASIRDLIMDSQDMEVQEALNQFYHLHIPDDERPSEGTVIDQVVQLVDLAGGNISPREAFLRMAGVRFNYQAAAGAFLEEPVNGSSSAWPSPGGGERAGDPDEVEGKGESASDDMEEEEEEEEEEDATTAVFRRYLTANPGIDRSVAKRGHPDQSKLTITIRQPDGRADKVMRYRGAVDFREPVQALNRWRSQIFRRHFGGSRPFRQHFHALEKDWLLQEHMRFEGHRLAQGKPVDYSAMRWVDIAERFNRHFKGRHLPGVKTPRPMRTAVALRTERTRVREITNHTGLRFAMRPRRGASNRPAKAGSEEEKGEDDSEEEKGEDSSEDEMDPRDISRRGDPPPGIKPWRKDEEDEDRGGGGYFLTTDPLERG